MSNMNNFLAQKFIDSLFRGTSAYAPAHLWIALLTTNAVKSDTGTQIMSGSGGTGVEVSAASYARQQLDPATGNWAAYSAGTQQTSNTPAIVFPTALSNWGTITGVALLDAATNGNILFQGALAASQAINSGGVFDFAGAALVVAIDN